MSRGRRRACAGVVGALLLTLVGGCSSSGPDPADDQHHPAATPAGSPRFSTYVALGDSYTAAPLVPSPRGDDGCFRSSHNYPSLVADALRVPDFRDRSCGGATTADLTTPQRPGVPPQLDAVDADTDLVTLSMGGNDDAVFGRLVAQCARLGQQHPTGAPCTAAAGTPGDLDRTISGVQTRLTRAVREIVRRAPHATVLVVGYPRIFPAHGTCADLPFAKSDYPFALRVNRRLDDALRAAALATDVGYVDVWHPSIGHDICSTRPWINGARTLFGRAAAYHPFGVEQRAVADLVLAALDARRR